MTKRCTDCRFWTQTHTSVGRCDHVSRFVRTRGHRRFPIDPACEHYEPTKPNEVVDQVRRGMYNADADHKLDAVASRLQQEIRSAN